MRLLHLSDLHLGKRVNEISMIEDQEYVINQIMRIIDEQKTEGVIIAGDVYDRKDPSTEAVQLFDDFLVRLAKKNQKVFIISGNHDSAERIAFAGRLLKANDIYISPVYDGRVEPIVMEDSYGVINFYLLPFVKPVHVKRFYAESEEINDYTDAIRVAVEQMNIDESARNVLIMHQFVVGAERSDSEEISVGGLDDVNSEVVNMFDYVALGHIHRPQKIQNKEHIRYCGTPLKYSFSEAAHNKVALVVDIKEKGQLQIEEIPLIPLRDMYRIIGSYDEITARDYYDGREFKNGYLEVTLTDENDIPEAIGRLRAIYPNIMRLKYDNTRTRTDSSVGVTERVEEKSQYELFSELFLLQNGKDFSDEQSEYVQSMIEKVWGGDR